jgi:phosphatidylglycerophosphatase A
VVSVPHRDSETLLFPSERLPSMASPKDNGSRIEGTGPATPRSPGAGPTSLREWVFLLLSTSFGLAYLPIAPGTWGALPGPLIYLLIVGFAAPGVHTMLIAGVLMAVCVLTVALSPWAERYWQMKDPKKYVPDEVAGFLVTVLLFRTPDPWLTCLWAFVVTRFVDIVKPPPARQLEALPGGWGILLDDVVASLYAALFLNILAANLPVLFGGPPLLALPW